MIKTSTHNDIIRYIYGETTSGENERIKLDLICNEETRDECYELESLMGSLKKTYKIPNERVIGNILNYSKYLELRPVK